MTNNNETYMENNNKNIDELYKEKYGANYSLLKDLFGEDMAIPLVDLWNSGLEMKIAASQSRFESAAIYRDKSKDIAKSLIECLKDKYLKVIQLKSQN